MKNLALIAALLGTLVLAGCNAGGETGDPSVGSNPTPPATSAGVRPGTPGAPALPPPPQRDAMGGRSGAAAGQ